MTTSAMVAPRYACAIIRDQDGQWLFEQRPPSARFAAGHMTCFGGHIEPGETARTALVRELAEELAWFHAPVPNQPVCALWVRGQLMAWFYQLIVDRPDQNWRQEPGFSRSWYKSWQDAERLSPWHSAVLSAWSAGECVAHVQH